MDKEIYSSSEIYDIIAKAHTIVKQSIVGIMRKNNTTLVDLTLDDKGRESDDDDYNKDFVEQNKVYAECYGYGKNGLDELGTIFEVRIDEKDNILLSAEGMESVYTNDYICHSTIVYCDILSRLEMMFKDKEK